MVKGQSKIILFLLLSASLVSCSTLPEEQKKDGFSRVYGVYEAPATRKIYYHPIGGKKTIIVQPSTNFLAGIEPSGLFQPRPELKEKPKSVFDGYLENHKREEIRILKRKIAQLTLERDKTRSQISSSNFSERDKTTPQISSSNVSEKDKTTPQISSSNVSERDGKCSSLNTKKVKLFPVFFTQMSASLRSENAVLIASAASIYKKTECSSIQLFSYTDSSGSTSLNTTLAQSRADTVQESLVKNGVSHDDIAIVLEPERDYLFSNRSVEGRQANRRVEIILRW